MFGRALAAGLLLSLHLVAQQAEQQLGTGAQTSIDSAYRSLAAATGGHALPLSPEELGTPAATQLMLALSLYDATILAIDQSLIDTPRSYGFPVDGSVRGLSAIVSGRAYVKLTGPDGLPIEPGHPGVEVVRLDRVTGYMIDTPAVGAWSIAVDASEPYLMTVEAKSAHDIVSARFVESGGRTGHKGLFPIDGNPAAGEPGQLEVNLMEPLQDVSIAFRRPNGEALTQATYRQNQGNVYLADVAIPDETFRVYVRGTDEAGNTIQRAESSTVSPQRFFVVPTGGSLAIWPGDPASVRFRLENRGNATSFVAYAVMSDGSLAPVEPQSFHVASGQSIDLKVSLRLPFDAHPGSTRELTLTVTDEQSGGFNSASQQVAVRRE